MIRWYLQSIQRGPRNPMGPIEWFDATKMTTKWFGGVLVTVEWSEEGNGSVIHRLIRWWSTLGHQISRWPEPGVSTTAGWGGDHRLIRWYPCSFGGTRPVSTESVGGTQNVAMSLQRLVFLVGAIYTPCPGHLRGAWAQWRYWFVFYTFLSAQSTKVLKRRLEQLA
jgi:hypothetical protein